MCRFAPYCDRENGCSARFTKPAAGARRRAEDPTAFAFSRLTAGARILLALILVGSTAGAAESWPPIALCPENPHYLFFRGRPAVLITSTEHYGAVLNLDFDYLTYLDELHSHGLNLTRTFTGVYCEAAGSFKIRGNPLAPKTGRLICPFARSNTPGYANGGNKFDLHHWDEAYFARLKDFIAQAGRRGIVVELVLFCPFYRDEMWNLSPLNARNNIQGIGHCTRAEVYTLKHPELLAVQEAMVRKIVGELKDFDNLYYEVCNEPYFGGVTVEWQHRIIHVIVETERDLPHKHLIAQNIANGSKKIERPHPAVSIFNFHYATPPRAVALNYHLNKVIADDETGFRGSEDFVYRAEGWDFLMAGGAIYDNLDYSFTPDHEDGSAVPDAPGGGGEQLRRQLAVLKQFVESFQFTRMKPDNSIIVGPLPEKLSARALAERARQYAVYVRGAGLRQLKLNLPAEMYRADWIDPRNGRLLGRKFVKHSGGEWLFEVPDYGRDIALRVVRVR